MEDVLSRMGDLRAVKATGAKTGQYGFDMAAESAATQVLVRAGLSVLSEESGLLADGGDGALLAVIDPVDGSTNAHRGAPWYATSLCVLDDTGPLAAVVVNLVQGTRYEAARGSGARRDGIAISPSGCARMGDAIVALSGYARRNIGWGQYRAFGAAALDICAVADGTVDAFAAAGGAELGPWDYLGAMLICIESGAIVAEAQGRDWVTRDHGSRRAPIAAATRELLDEIKAAAGEIGGL